jgi:hypothetical protein
MSDNKRALVNASVMLLGTSSGIFMAFCPDFHTVASAQFHAENAKPRNVRRTRWGECCAGVVVLGIGVAVAYAHDSIIPFAAAAILAFAFVSAYEYMMSHPATVAH